ncbi:MAG: hypothetical protein HRU72_03290 [Planctomycetia bacterium]|nr:MAG: hypothetical protein HRU72_03290 [Planctomycetia bacterium]
MNDKTWTNKVCPCHPEMKACVIFQVCKWSGMSWHNGERDAALAIGERHL